MEILPEKSQLVISEEFMPIAAYQAIYHKLTQKTEKLSQTFEDAYDIGRDDLKNLDHIIQQSIRQYPIEASSCTIDVSIKRGQSLSFTSHERFSKHGFTTPKPTSGISYNFEFMTCLPTETARAAVLTQRYKISILMDQEIYDPDDNIPPFLLRKFILGDNITLRIEYVDYNVALNLQAAVVDWVGGLQTSKPNKFVRYLLKKEDTINLLVPRFVLISTLIGSTGVLSNDNTIADLPIQQSIMIATAISVIVYSFAQVVTTKLISSFNSMLPRSSILLTVGDQKRFEAGKNGDSKRKTVFVLLLTTLMVTVPISLFTKWLGLLIFKG